MKTDCRLGLLVLGALFLSSCSSRTCDDCLHPALKVTIRDSGTGKIVYPLRSMIVTFNGLADTITDSLVLNGYLFGDTAYAVLSGSGVYSLIALADGYDSVKVSGIRVAADPDCGSALTRHIGIAVDPVTPAREKAARRETQVIYNYENGNCG